MKTLVLSILTAALAQAILGQGPLPVLKSSDDRIFFVEGVAASQSQRYSFLNKDQKPWVVEIPIMYEKPMKVWVANGDGDAIETELRSGQTFDFNIEIEGKIFPARLVGKKTVLPFIRYSQGNPDDVRPLAKGPLMQLDGGGWPGDAVLQETINRLRGCKDCDSKIDVVHLSVPDSYTKDRSLQYFLTEHVYLMDGVDSVEGYILESPELADLDEVVKSVARAELVFFDGGRPCELIQAYRGSKLEAEIIKLYKRGGAIVGTGAGQALQGGSLLDTCEEKLLSDLKESRSNGAFDNFLKKNPQLAKVGSIALNADAALSDPYAETIVPAIFNWPDLKNTIVESRAASKKQLGQLLATLAQQLKDGKSKTAHAIAVDENASVIIDGNGMATVAGKSVAYFITADHKPEICEKGKPLTYSDFKVWKLKPGETLNLRKRPATGFYTVSVTEGKLSRDPY